MRRVHGLWGFLAAVLLLSACGKQRLKLGEQAGGEVIEAEGLVPYRQDDLPGTKAAGLAAAQRSAVERVVGVFLAAQTRVDKSVMVEQRILGKTAGYIQKYDVLEEKREGGYWKTRIRALVSFDQVGMDLKDLGLLDPRDIGSPRVAVLIDEQVDGDAAATTHAADGLTEKLIEGNFTVVDRSAKAGAALQKIIDAVEKGDTASVTDLGSKLGVEVVLLGEAQANRLDPHPQFKGFFSYRARVSAKAVRSGTGQVLSSVSREASGLDVDVAAAAAKSLQNAAQLLGEELLPKMSEVLRSRSEVLLKVSGLKDMDQLKSLQEALRALSGMEGVYLRHYGEGQAEISLSAGSVQGSELAGRLSKLKSPGLSVSSASSSEIVASLAQ